MARINRLRAVPPTNIRFVTTTEPVRPPVVGVLLLARTIDHGISGEILSLLDHEGLKEVGVHSVGQRLAILKEVYYLKVQHGIPIEPEHYVPPCSYPLASVSEPLSPNAQAAH